MTGTGARARRGLPLHGGQVEAPPQVPHLTISAPVPREPSSPRKRVSPAPFPQAQVQGEEAAGPR